MIINKFLQVPKKAHSFLEEVTIAKIGSTKRGLWLGTSLHISSDLIDIFLLIEIWSSKQSKTWLVMTILQAARMIF